jgi:hypothetical protein
VEERVVEEWWKSGGRVVEEREVEEWWKRKVEERGGRVGGHCTEFCVLIVLL